MAALPRNPPGRVSLSSHHQLSVFLSRDSHFYLLSPHLHHAVLSSLCSHHCSEPLSLSCPGHHQPSSGATSLCSSPHLLAVLGAGGTSSFFRCILVLVPVTPISLAFLLLSPCPACPLVTLAGTPGRLLGTNLSQARSGPAFSVGLWSHMASCTSVCCPVLAHACTLCVLSEHRCAELSDSLIPSLTCPIAVSN